MLYTLLYTFKEKPANADTDGISFFVNYMGHLLD